MGSTAAEIIATEQRSRPAAIRVGLFTLLAFAITVVLTQQSDLYGLSAGSKTNTPSNFPVARKNALHLTLLEWEYFLASSTNYASSTSYASADISAETSSTELTAGEVASLESHMHRRLPRYYDLFRKVASEHRIDWHLVAAISYQESHWHPKAKSPTGVRGMMMLTLPTAKEMGIRNRLDAEQSVRGGVRYLESLKSRLPETLQEPDRTWQALAAYNVGIGHLYDARTLTRNKGGNPDDWAHLSEYLLKLEDPKWHSQTRFGYARGTESVQYVGNIQRYYRHILTTHAPNKAPRRTTTIANNSQATPSTI
ncbi:transglycosylase SLT domain-containing protein [Parendozoicomonas sp. Alg238-R29]|uniref:transglycosylase SLT domain-containing protein n=1 Tax=Parendozoicomonas sp. Alg238-R29 TaxID=2993446 RepID=UPI00248EC2F0|nr:transglycosylase SLT domain-containing protein [Parendozoicomonas sp. Alg238-R29]